ncbi:uncharacterized protein LOC6502229 isoform X2 [Drosophila ananassae]|uniref:uncharacterized protein LOC6502229 isoform X2 n=1 Tax=Drosophila ananassae TaxID=7217 RepID=UPI001CFF9EB3|nr:uncharacterized protein LOC6502229 isoform X2 [Drosophila ananassae]
MKPGPEALEEGEEEGEGQDHHEGDPRPLPYDFEKELIQKSNRHIRLCESFVPVSQGPVILRVAQKELFIFSHKSLHRSEVGNFVLS